MANYSCEKCGKSMDESNFYTYKSGEKTEMCKKCMTMHIDNFDPETYLWLLEKMDVPYIPEEWNKIRDRAYAKNPLKMNGMSVFGKYLSNMKLKQWKDYGWADTETLQAELAEKAETKKPKNDKKDTDLRLKFEAGEITEAEYRTLASTEEQRKFDYAAPITPIASSMGNPFAVDNFIDLPDPASELTEEDKIYLAMKWGRLYQPHEWLALEQTYTEMTDSFDIQDADTINTLMFICKTKLKMDQALDANDVESFQKLSKVYNDLRKTAKFTAAQNKEEKSEFVDCIGNLVAYCEKEGGAIPKYEIETDLDIVDKVIRDLKKYTKDLIYEDKALANQIENYLKKREISEQQKKDKENAAAQGLDEVELEDKDYEEYYDAIEESKKLDAQMLQDKGDEGE